MITFRAKSNKIIGALSVLALLAFLAVENSKVDVRQKWYREKTGSCNAFSRSCLQH
ncbi:MAG: hypothetical protein R2759_01840 [Bacteroidales bacterium]